MCLRHTAHLQDLTTCMHACACYICWGNALVFVLYHDDEAYAPRCDPTFLLGAQQSCAACLQCCKLQFFEQIQVAAHV